MIPCGSNLTYLDLAHTQGYVAQYHVIRAGALEVFAEMRKNGQTSAKIFLPHWAAEENFVPNGFVLPLGRDSQLDAQSSTNLQAMVKDLIAVGFDHINLAPGPMGNTLSPWQWSGELGDRWEREGLFCWNLRTQFRDLCRAASVDFSVVFGGDDYFTDQCPLVIPYAQTLWTWWTASCTAVGQEKGAYFAIPADSKSIANAVRVFRGLDPNGAPNWPDVFSLAGYGNDEWRSVYASVKGMLSALESIGAPKTIPFEISETYAFTDLTNLIQICRAIEDLQADGWKCGGIHQWGVVRDAADPNPDHNANPTLAGVPAWM